MEQFAEAADITQGETMVNVSCVIPNDLLPLSTLCDQHPLLRSLFESLVLPASSAPVERVFGHIGLACRMTQWKCWCFWLVSVGYRPKLQMMPITFLRLLIF